MNRGQGMTPTHYEKVRVPGALCGIDNSGRQLALAGYGALPTCKKCLREWKRICVATISAARAA